MWELMGTMHNFRPTLGTRKDPTSMIALAVSRRSSVLGPEVNSPGPVWLATCCPAYLISSAAPLSPPPPRPGKFIVASVVATPCRDKSSVSNSPSRLDRPQPLSKGASGAALAASYWKLPMNVQLLRQTTTVLLSAGSGP